MAKKSKGSKPAKLTREPQSKEPMCVFAFRLPVKDREAIHKAAGRGQATQFALAALRAAVERAQKATK